MFSFSKYLLGAALVVLAGCNRDAVSLNIDFPAVYVVNGSSATVSVIHAENQQNAATIELNDPNMTDHSAMLEWPHHASLSPDGSLLALAVPGIDLSAGHSGSHPEHGGHLLVIEAATGAIVFDKLLDAPNHGAMFSPDGAEIWTTAMQDSGAVLVFEAKTLTQIHRLPVGAMPAEVTFSRDGSLVFVANGEDNTVSVFGAADKQLRATIATGAGPVGAWPGSDTTMIVDNETDQSLSIISTKSLQVVENVQLGFMPGMAAWHLGKIWVTDATNGRLVVYENSGNGFVETAAVRTGAGAHGIAFSPDGSLAWVSNQLENTLSVVRTADLAKVTDIATGMRPNGVLFRP